MNMTATRTHDAATTKSPGAVLRRACSGCGKHSHGPTQCPECSKKKLQRKSAGISAPAAAPSLVHEVLATPGRPLDASSRAWMEPRFGHDFSGVRLHTDGPAAESARQVGALAYAVGQHVVFDHHQYAPHTSAGRHLLAHELAHTIQDPGAGGLHASLQIGESNDASERAAGRAADAVARGDNASVARAGGGLVRRQVADCTAKEGDSPDQRLVHCPDGSDYRVKLTLTDKPAQPETHTTVNAGWNDNVISLTISICRGDNQVLIEPNIQGLPQAVGAALANLVARSDLLKDVSITPGLKFNIVHTGTYTLSVGPTVTVDQNGVSGVGGEVEVQTKDVDVKAGATYDPRSKTGFLNFTFSAGSPQPTVSCYGKVKQYAVFACERISHVTAVPPVEAQTEQDAQTRYLFFNYAHDTINPKMPAPTDISALVNDGYKITSIRGFTSPEGPRGGEHKPKFEGNVELAKERADAAKNWLQRPEICKECDLGGVTVEGQSELPPEQGKQQPEPKGSAMEHGAVDEFLGKSPGSRADPLAPGDPDARKKFERMPFDQQRERAYDLMRRAVIVLQRTRTIKLAEPGKAAHDDFNTVGCTPQVTDAAQKSFGINVGTGGIVTRPGDK
jgi:hypothetical protein